MILLKVKEEGIGSVEYGLPDLAMCLWLMKRIGSKKSDPIFHIKTFCAEYADGVVYEADGVEILKAVFRRIGHKHQVNRIDVELKEYVNGKLNS